MIKNLLDKKIIKEAVIDKKVKVQEKVEEKKESVEKKLDEKKVLILGIIFTSGVILGFILAKKTRKHSLRAKLEKKRKKQKQRKAIVQSAAVIMKVIKLLG